MPDPRIAIVTGSDSGIGRATAVRLAEEGCDVGITWHTDSDGARATAEEVASHGRRAEVRRLDVSSAANAVQVVRELTEALGGLDVFVNNAGTGHQTPVLEVDEQTFRHVVDTDLTGAFFAAQQAAKTMVAQGRGGPDVNCTSDREYRPLKRSSA